MSRARGEELDRRLGTADAVALTVGAYAAPSAARPVAVLAVAALVMANLRGIASTARLARVLLAAVLGVLGLVVAAALLAGDPGGARRPGGGRVTNAAALTLRAEQRRFPRAVPVVGLLGCGVLAATLPTTPVVAGTAVLAVGALLHALRRRQTTEPHAAGGQRGARSASEAAQRRWCPGGTTSTTVRSTDDSRPSLTCTATG